MKIKQTLASLVTSFVIAVGAVPAVAQASAVVPNTGCNSYTASSTTHDALNYYTALQTVPSTSSCNDIQVRNFSYQNPAYTCTFGITNMQLEFFPTGKPAYFGSLHTVYCDNPNAPWTILATNVLDGTKFKVVGDSANGSFDIDIED